MPSLGIIVLNLNQEKSYYKRIANQLTAGEVEVYLFKPTAIQPFTEKINGQRYHPEKKTWEPATFPIPDYLYDRCFYSSKAKFKTNYPIVQWLKNRTTFLGHGLPGKWKVYERLRTDPVLKFYLIDTQKADTSQSILQQLKKYKSMVLKPEAGSQGNGIFLLQQGADGITVKTQRGAKIGHKVFTDSKELNNWLKKLLSKTAFISQPFLSLQDNEGKPFDIRILIEKDEHGQWREAGRGVRVGKKRGITSNLHGGGDIVNYEDWIETLPQSQKTYIQEETATIIEQTPEVLEQSFGQLVELGLDIGVDNNGAVWILEVNSKPGHQVILRNNPDYTPLPYSTHLFQQKELISNAQSDNDSKDIRK